MKQNELILLKKFKIKKTTRRGGKRIVKNESNLRKDIYNKMKQKNSIGKRPTKRVCNAYLSEQIKRNIRSGKWHFKQAIAIAYKQINTKQASCKKYYAR